MVAPQSSSNPTHSFGCCPEDTSHHISVPLSSTGYNPEVEGWLAGQDGPSALSWQSCSCNARLLSGLCSARAEQEHLLIPHIALVQCCPNITYSRICPRVVFALCSFLFPATENIQRFSATKPLALLLLNPAILCMHMSSATAGSTTSMAFISLKTLRLLKDNPGVTPGFNLCSPCRNFMGFFDNVLSCCFLEKLVFVPWTMGCLWSNYLNEIS